MKLIADKELKTDEEVVEYFKENDIVLNDYRNAVIALITDNNDRILLQRRGPKSRDEENRLADIGGAVEESDKDFREALKREIIEEVGNEVNIQIENFVCCFLCCKYDSRSKKEVNWLFWVYKCRYIDGNLLFNEPGKCLGYEFYKYNELPRNEMLDTTKEFWDYYKTL